LLNDEITGILKEYFLKPFREKEENYFRFANEVDVEFHPLFEIISNTFLEPATVHENSKKIATHLFDQSNHPHIKSGEVYVAHFSDMVLDNQKVDAIGIFKSELKHDFLQFREEESNLDIVIQQGV